MENVFRTVALTEIGDSVGNAPNSRFRRSIRRMGVVQPVVLAEKVLDSGEVQYAIIDGNRRIAAARAAKLKQIPAIILSGLTSAQMAQLTLVANGYRSANYLTEFWAIKTLERHQFSENEIQMIAGFSDSSIATRDHLRNLHRELFVALRNGRLPQTYALAIAKLDKEHQQSLAQIFRTRGRILKREIDKLTASSKSADENIRIWSPEQPINPNPQYEVTFIEKGGLVSGNRLAVSTGSREIPDDSGFNNSTELPSSRKLIDNFDADLHTHMLIKTSLTPDQKTTGMATADSPTGPDSGCSLKDSEYLVQLMQQASELARAMGQSREDFLTLASTSWELSS